MVDSIIYFDELIKHVILEIKMISDIIDSFISPVSSMWKYASAVSSRNDMSRNVLSNFDIHSVR